MGILFDDDIKQKPNPVNPSDELTQDKEDKHQ
jgi:hypothetical protein